MGELNIHEQMLARGIDSFMHPNESVRLAELATGRDCLEIGAFKGGSTWVMAQTAKSVMSVDTFAANDAGTIQTEELTTLDAYLKAIEGLPNVSYFVGTSAEAAKKIKRKFDLIFIDADHSEEAVRQDIALWWPRVKRGGLMVFHDCFRDHGYFPGVYKAVHERFGDLPTEITLAWVEK